MNESTQIEIHVSVSEYKDYVQSVGSRWTSCSITCHACVLNPTKQMQIYSHTHFHTSSCQSQYKEGSTTLPHIHTCAHRLAYIQYRKVTFHIIYCSVSDLRTHRFYLHYLFILFIPYNETLFANSHHINNSQYLLGKNNKYEKIQYC